MGGEHVITMTVTVTVTVTVIVTVIVTVTVTRQGRKRKNEKDNKIKVVHERTKIVGLRRCWSRLLQESIRTGVRVAIASKAIVANTLRTFHICQVAHTSMASRKSVGLARKISLGLIVPVVK